jgi:hypothetical protein
MLYGVHGMDRQRERIHSKSFGIYARHGNMAVDCSRYLYSLYLWKVDQKIFQKEVNEAIQNPIQACSALLFYALK